MRAQIQKWGNSLGLRIPKVLAKDVEVHEGSEVELSVEDGRLVVAPQREPRRSIVELVAAISADNMHRETATGSPVGHEVW